MRLTCLALLALLVLPMRLHAATITADSCSYTDVSAALGLASNGDTVSVPAGACTWDRHLFIPLYVTLKGAGAGSTVITDGINKNAPAGDGAAPLISVISPAGGLMRITGFTFDGGTATGILNYGMLIVALDNSTTWRIDHNHFLARRSMAITVYNGGGVIDHNTFDLYNGNVGPGIYGFNGTQYAYGAGATVHGDASWADVSDWGGSTKAYFIEDNTFNVPSGESWTWSHDGWLGERVVFRFNTVNRASFNNHGTEQRERSGRTWELYANVFSYPVSDAPDAGIGLRGGTGMVWENAMTAATGQPTSFGHVTYPRAWSPVFQFGMCNALNAWDSNDATVVVSGTHTGLNGATTLTDTTKTWTANQWVGYVVTNTTLSASGSVETNGLTSATFHLKLDSSPAVTFNAGNSYAMRVPGPCIDQPGRGRGDHVSGDTPINTDQGNTAAWLRQDRDPVYAWHNTFNSSPTAFTSFAPTIAIEGREFFNETTGNVVVGTTLPGSCTDGHGYWKTNAGSWNAGSNSQYAGQGVLYTCASNTWSVHYTPYTYPHPLVSGDSSPLVPPLFRMHQR